MIEKVTQIINDVKDELVVLSEFILANPELGHEEVKAAKAHTDLLKKHGFTVEEAYLDMKTAFRAEMNGKKDGPTIAFLAEYDALPGIGHGCGHNLLGTTSTGAGIVLSKLFDEIGGRVIVMGTPAEETCGGKVPMVDQGAFDDIDIVMMSHPSSKYGRSGRSLAMEAIQFTFKGRTAHAASKPEKGINALDACINTFNMINALREHIKSSARIHGIIAEGGKAANVVPDLAIAQFYARATTKAYLQELVEKVKNCARGASLAAGTELEITNYETSYDDLVTNETLMDQFEKRIRDMGVKTMENAGPAHGSVDAGNVSHVCPTIHPYFSICDKDVIGHTREFAEKTKEPLAYEGMKNTIGALVLTAIDIIQDQELLQKIQEEFARQKSAKESE